MPAKNISLTDETIARVKRLDREQMPSLSALVERLLVAELDRIEAAARRPRRREKIA